MEPAYQKLTQPERDAQDRLVLQQMYDHLLKADDLIRFLSPERKGDIQKALVQARDAVFGPKYNLEQKR